MSPTTRWKTHGTSTSFGAQVLILLAAALFGGDMLGGGGEQEPLTERVANIIQDETRRAEAVKCTQQIEGVLRTTLNDFTQFRKATLTAMRGSGGDTGELLRGLEGTLLQTRDIESHVLDLRFQLRDIMTREEWNELFAGLREDNVRVRQTLKD